MSTTTRTSVDHFERLYQGRADPWGFESSRYELQRYQTLLALLGRMRYQHALEAGCSIGVFTSLLATRCERLLAFDFAPSAVDAARQRCRSQPQVTLEIADLTLVEPEGRFDLIIFSEIGYYFELDVLRNIATRMADWLDADAELIAGHWLGRSDDHVLHGDTVHDTLLEVLPLSHVRSERHGDFRVDKWRR